jgi:hypothetical protein
MVTTWSPQPGEKIKLTWGQSVYNDLVSLENLAKHEIPVYMGYIPRDLATDSTGEKYVSGAYYLSNSLLQKAQAVYFESNLDQLTGGTVRLYLRNLSDNVDVAYLEYSVAMPYQRTDNIKSLLVGDKWYRTRFYVVSAGVLTSKGGGCLPRLIVVL